MICTVRDQFGNDCTVWIYVQIENGLTAEAVQSYFSVLPGDSVTLEVTAQATDETDLSYQWYDDCWNALDGETAAVLQQPATASTPRARNERQGFMVMFLAVGWCGETV